MFIFDTCWKIFFVNIFKKRHYLKQIKKRKKSRKRMENSMPTSLTDRSTPTPSTWYVYIYIYIYICPSIAKFINTAGHWKDDYPSRDKTVVVPFTLLVYKPITDLIQVVSWLLRANTTRMPQLIPYNATKCWLVTDQFQFCFTLSCLTSIQLLDAWLR